MSALNAIDWHILDHAAAEPVAIGDVVSVDAGGMPIYRVVGLEDGQLLLGGERGPSLHLMPLDRFRWRGALAA